MVLQLTFHLQQPVPPKTEGAVFHHPLVVPHLRQLWCEEINQVCSHKRRGYISENLLEEFGVFLHVVQQPQAFQTIFESKN